ncbi:UNVERIFIED_CONTAM: hypothetical protein Slati_2200900 [Sesamum latifolium]|uniref:Uncharacterized protein n=1 Tax=Sesamum latifolium TaxID=2727402 RepID=A0AAW2WWB7_9LAMI
MMIDASGPIFPPAHVSHQPNEKEIGISSNDRGGNLLDVVSAADQPLYSGSENHSQLSVVARLRLYASNTTAEHMSWHATHEIENVLMCNPSDAKAWKHFNETHPDFASEPCNVCLGLCADGFAPHGQYGKSYSCWSVIITPYNLPPGMCMKSEYMFLSLIIPGPANLKRLIDVYLQL